VNPEHSQLNCLVLSKQHEHHKLVSTWLGESKRVGGVTAVTDENSLNRCLCRAQTHLCIVVMEKHDRVLPACMSSHLDVPVLVLTISRKPGKLKKWFQQGASEVVSLRKSAVAKHAISRLLDECELKQNQLFLQEQIRLLEKEVAYLQSLLNRDKNALSRSAANDAKHNAIDRVEAQLKRMHQPVVENIISNYKPREITTGLQTRISALERFQQILSYEIKSPRITALLVSILTDSNTTDQSGTANDVQNLTLYRAADTLQKRLHTGTLLGRINHNALLLIQTSDDEPVSRDAANRVRDSLGSLGGLIDAETDVRINTMNLPATTCISANEVVARLEASIN